MSDYPESPGGQTAGALRRLVDAYKLNPAAVQAGMINLGIKLLIVGVLCVVSFMQGKDYANNSWETKYAEQKATISKLQADNARDSLQRTIERGQEQSRIDAAAANAREEVHKYYAQNPPDPRVVETTKLVPVPGKDGYVYVPIGTCPNDFFNDDELRLWNLGAAGYGPDADNPK